MKAIIKIVFFLLLTLKVVGQTNENCSWTFETGITVSASSIFHLTKTHSIALCGSVDTIRNKQIYSNIVLFECGKKDKIIESDGASIFTIKQKKDTLIVQEFYAIPNQINQEVKWQEFYVTKYFFRNDSVRSISGYRKDLKKYTSKQIEKVLTEFKEAEKHLDKFDNYLLCVNKVFWAYVSGSQSAKLILDELTKKYGMFDGAIAEEFDALIMTYDDYHSCQH